MRENTGRQIIHRIRCKDNKDKVSLESALMHLKQAVNKTTIGQKQLNWSELNTV